ncbi:MAG: glycosyltransferase [Eubacteriales bacterium]
MSKLLTIVVPCYHSEAYMEKCIESLLPGGERVEILIVNDGSFKDRTGEIADSLAERYPDIIRVIHQENKGHGGALNTGITAARGHFIKVVDSDDWLDREAYMAVLDRLQASLDEGQVLDLLISNYVYEKVDANHKLTMRYRMVFPHNRYFTWSDTRRMPVGQYLMMHSLTYRTELLRDCGLVMPQHVFYVDNLYAYVPLPFVRTMYYLDVDLYRYFIGRPDQSVHEKNIIAHIDQQVMVNKMMVEARDLTTLTDRKLQSYMYHYLSILTVISSTFLLMQDEPDSRARMHALWQYIKDRNPAMYQHLYRRSLMGLTIRLRGKVGRFLMLRMYRMARRIYGFN